MLDSNKQNAAADDDFQETSQEKRGLSGWKLVRLKLLAALFVGVVAAAVGCLIGLCSLRQPYSWVCLPQRQTVFPKMFLLAKDLAEYKEKFGVYPPTLTELANQQTDSDGKPLKIDAPWLAYYIQDGWQNPLNYTSDGTTWELVSYGEDGKLGGIGIDADIRCTDDSNPTLGGDLFTKLMTPTISQIFQSKRFHATALFSGLFGIVAFIGAAYQMFSKKSKSRVTITNRREAIAAAIGIAIGASLTIAVLVAIQSVASGH
ncbi:MAG: type II secretion system protein GspG [Thermoguttaceae bacterium]